MNEQEVAVLLTYCAGADSRFNTPDADQARARVKVWLDLLSEVAARFALDHVQRYYAVEQRWPVQPGAIRKAWAHHLTAIESKERVAALYAAGGGPRELSEVARTQLGQAKAAVAEQQAAYEQQPRHPRQLQHPVPSDG